MTDQAEAFVVAMPRRCFGKPTIGHSRLPVATVADVYWFHGLTEVLAMWDHLTELQVKVCCWYVARYGTRTERNRFKAWLPTASDMLWSVTTEDACPLPPTATQ